MLKKIIEHYKIYHVNDNYKYSIGYLHLVKMSDASFYELEYYIDKEYRNKGLMSIQLPIYLDKIKKEGYNIIIANVKKDNVASKKLLKKNGFFKLSEIGKDVENYIKINVYK